MLQYKKVIYKAKVYLNAKGDLKLLLLTHDVKRVLKDSNIKNGFLQVTSMCATTGITLMEADSNLHQLYYTHLQDICNASTVVESQEFLKPKPSVKPRSLPYRDETSAEKPKDIKINSMVKSRSGASEARFHVMAAQAGLTLTVPVVDGLLMISPFHEIYAVDCEPKVGRREFGIFLMGEDPPSEAKR